MDVIYQRRSIRAYQPRPVPRETVERIIKAGMNAPSAGNEQPWQFVVIDQKELLEQIPSIHPHSKMILQAPVAILVCGDQRLVTREGYWAQDCSAAVENMLLAAVSEGLGSVWLGVYPREDRVTGLRKLLDIPEEVTPFALLPIGHPDEKKPLKDEFHPERIHYNGWNSGAS